MKILIAKVLIIPKLIALGANYASEIQYYCDEFLELFDNEAKKKLQKKRGLKIKCTKTIQNSIWE